MDIKTSELILNSDGSIYHLNLKPEHIAKDIIFVGDPDRVDMVIEHFDNIEFTVQKREFKTVTGYYKGKRLSVISTGIGSDNIDIVLNELDALVNIDLSQRTIKREHSSLNIIRIGTSGSLQADIPVNSFLLSTHALDINGMLCFYALDTIQNTDIEEAFIAHTQWNPRQSRPIAIEGSRKLQKLLASDKTYLGITLTTAGFYGPQGRVLRLPVSNPNLNASIETFQYKGIRATNLEMETSAIYGLSKLLGHHACSMNAILANRALGEFSKNPSKVIEELIVYALDRIVN